MNVKRFVLAILVAAITLPLFAKESGIRPNLTDAQKAALKKRSPGAVPATTPTWAKPGPREKGKIVLRDRKGQVQRATKAKWTVPKSKPLPKPVSKPKSKPKPTPAHSK